MGPTSGEIGWSTCARPGRSTSSSPSKPPTIPPSRPLPRGRRATTPPHWSAASCRATASNAFACWRRRSIGWKLRSLAIPNPPIALHLAETYLSLLPASPFARPTVETALATSAKLIERVDAAIAITEGLLAEDPDDNAYRWLFGAAVTEKARLDLEAKRKPDIDRLRKAVASMSGAGFESRMDVQRILTGRATLLRALQASGDSDGTAQEVQRTLRFLEGLPARGGRRPGGRERVPTSARANLQHRADPKADRSEPRPRRSSSGDGSSRSGVDVNAPEIHRRP